MADPLRSSNLQESSLCVNGDFTPILHHLLTSIDDALLWIDLQGTVREASRVACEKLKASPKKRFWDLWADDHFGFSMKEALSFGICPQKIYKRIEERDWEIAASFSYTGPKTAWGLFLNLRDVTEIARLKQELKKDDQMRDLGKVAATVAHEIQNPLGGIRGYASLLFKDLKQEPHLQEMAGAVVEGTKRLEKQVQAILQYARPLQLELESVDLSLYLKRFCRMVRIDPACPDNIEWALHIPNSPVIAPIDPAALQRALYNLVFNAFQAMPRGGMLTLSLMRLEGCCQIAVSDTGVGMGEELQKNLFSPFFTTKQGGHGIGLIETRKVILAHSGTIEVRSQSGKGSTFTLTLPLKR